MFHTIEKGDAPDGVVGQYDGLQGARGDGAPAAPSLSEEEGEKPVCRRALVVDDAPDVTEMLAMLMRFAGYEVTMAFSAADALGAARRDHFDMVVSDIGMPVMNGYQLAEALRQLPDYKRVPLIAVTGFTQYDDRARAISSGFNDFLTKPINPNDLLEVIKRLCG